jgi:hypothetical protein
METCKINDVEYRTEESPCSGKCQGCAGLESANLCADLPLCYTSTSDFIWVRVENKPTDA